jgi:hypothetical protein
MRSVVSVIFAVFMVLFFVVSAVCAAQQGTMRTVTGKVVAVDDAGKGIVVSTPIGNNQVMDVGAIVNAETVIKVAGKKASLSDIKVGDTAKLRYLKSDDLYAKEISTK